MRVIVVVMVGAWKWVCGGKGGGGGAGEGGCRGCGVQGWCGMVE